MFFGERIYNTPTPSKLKDEDIVHAFRERGFT